MIELTQTNLAPFGNCWQTAIACVLELPAEELPDQSAIERHDEEVCRPARLAARGDGQESPAWMSWFRYHNALNVYLAKHHGLGYQELYRFQLPGVAIRRSHHAGHHLICGPTVRTPETKIDHVIVGRYGKPVWDPHPSRAFLTKVRSWGLLGELWDAPDGPMYDALPCLCPACGGLEQLATP